MQDALLSWFAAQRARSPLAEDARPVRDPRQRGDAAADAGRAGRAAVRRMARALAERGGARGGAGGGRHPGVAGAGLQPAGAQPPPGGAGGRRDRLAGRPDRLPGVGRYTADAIRSFALGEPVLPMDTNVARVQERTGHRFGPECGQALMDLGATVCLARVPRCRGARSPRPAPHAGCASRRRAGRDRSKARSGSAARARCGSSPMRRARCPKLDPEAVAALERDGLVRVENRVVSLP